MSYQVIARKYRPQTFDEVVGQRLVSETLKNAILTDRVAHSYIFSGARGVGKTTMARILARALNCAQGPTVTPCGHCDSCREIAAGNSVDVLEIDAASNRGIDEIRELRESVRYMPARDRNKIFIIDEAHMLTTEAFNALLKTLEEPPPRSLFVLATTEAHKLPATIQSRCQHFVFRLLDFDEISSCLRGICAREKVEIDEGALSAIAQAGEGSLRDAQSLLDEAITACGAHVDEDRVRRLLGVAPAHLLRGLVESIQRASAQSVLEQVGQLAAGGYDLTTFCGELTRTIRNLMIARTCGAESRLLQVPAGERAALESLAASLSEEDLTRFFQVLLQAQSEMRHSLNPRFHLELALMKLVHAPKLVNLEKLLRAVEAQAPPPRPTPSGSQGSPGSSAGGRTAAGSGAPAGSEPPRPAVPPWKRPAPASSGQSAAGQGARTFAAPAVSPRPAPTNLSQPKPEAPPPLDSDAGPDPEYLEPVSDLEPETRARAGAGSSSEDARLAAIKAVLFEQSKFLGSCLNPVTGWRFENGRAEFILSREGSWALDLLKGREHQEKLRAACEKVLGQPVQIHVTLAAEEGSSAAPRLTAQHRAQSHPVVIALQKRFDCVLMDVKDLSQE